MEKKLFLLKDLLRILNALNEDLIFDDLHFSLNRDGKTLFYAYDSNGKININFDLAPIGGFAKEQSVEKLDTEF